MIPTELTPDFWRRYAETRKRSLKREKVATGKKWDKIAGHYHKFEDDQDFVKEQDDLRQAMLDRGMLADDVHLLDMACGPGTHCFALARHCARVTAVDVSAKMIAELRRRQAQVKATNLEIRQCDFYDFPEVEKFDTVFVSMSPILNQLTSVDHLLSLSRRYLVLAYWAGVRENPLFNYCYQMIFQQEYQWDAMDITTIFNYLYSLGQAPEISYLHPVWERSGPLEETVDHLIWHLEFYRPLTASEQIRVREYVASLADEKGVVSYRTRVRKGLLFLDQAAGRETSCVP